MRRLFLAWLIVGGVLLGPATAQTVTPDMLGPAWSAAPAHERGRWAVATQAKVKPLLSADGAWNYAADIAGCLNWMTGRTPGRGADTIAETRFMSVGELTEICVKRIALGAMPWPRQ